MGEFRRNLQLGRLEEVHRNQPGNVGDREPIAGREAPSRQLPVEERQKFDHARLVGLAPGRHLGNLVLAHPGMQMAEYLGDPK